MKKNVHLTLEDRIMIEEGIKKGLTKTDIALSIMKDPSTVAKEIKAHRFIQINNTGFKGRNCIHQKDCGQCLRKCTRFKEIPCLRRDRSPGACNGCTKRGYCSKTIFLYDGKQANDDYEKRLVETRIGINKTAKEFEIMVNIVVPALEKKQSPYHIITAHPELDISEKTLYNYIEWGYFTQYGITDVSLKRKVKMKTKTKQLKKRKDARHYLGRLHKDYLEFCRVNHFDTTPQMDAVFNDVSKGPFIQTFVFPQSSLLIAFLHKKLNSASMLEGVNRLYKMLGHDDFIKLFPAILTDRGSEFAKPELLEVNNETGEVRTNIFYCDPLQSSQKAHVEKAHTTLREIIPNKIDLSFLTQEKLDCACNHVNSMLRERQHGKSAYDTFQFFYGKEILSKLNIQKIEKDQVNLAPTLIK